MPPDFPTIQSPAYPLKEDTSRPVIRTAFENGQVLSRARATRARKKWALSWPSMPSADYLTLRAFFESNVGGTFGWTHPLGGSYTVRFTSDALSASLVLPGYYQVSLELEED